MACPALLSQSFDEGLHKPVGSGTPLHGCKEEASHGQESTLLSKQLQILNLRGSGACENEKQAPPVVSQRSRVGTGTVPGCIMDCELWGKLPDDIFARIFLKLPAASHFKFRAVCKSWRASLSSLKFLRQWAAVTSTVTPLFTLPQRQSGLRECGDHCSGDEVKSRAQLSLPEASRYEVHRLDLSFLPNKISKICYLHHGLICLRSFPETANTLSLVVCNPLTMTFKELPDVAMQESRTWMVAIVDDSCGDAFRVVLIISDTDDQHDKFWTIRVYSSGSNSWRVTETDSFCPLRFLSSSLLHDSLMYTSLFHGELLLYNTDNGLLLQSSYVPMPASVSNEYYQLVQHQGGVYLVAQVETDCEVTFGIWKLDQSKMMWEEYSIFPLSQWNDLINELGKDWNLDDCTDVELLDGRVIGDFIFVSVDIHNNQAEIGSNYRTQVLAFHVHSKSWQIFYNGFVVGDPPYLLEPRFDLFL